MPTETLSFETIESWVFTNLDELVAALSEARETALRLDRFSISYVASDGFDCSEIAGRVSLYERRLTDDSIVYDIRIGDVAEGSDDAKIGNIARAADRLFASS